MEQGSALLVCVNCRAPGADPAAPRPGAVLLSAVLASAAGSGVQVEGVTCLSGCKRACAVALAAPGRVTYVFGDLPPDGASAAELVRAARDHARMPDGWMPRATRPERLRAGILTRVPPLHWQPAGEGGTIGWPL